MTGCLSDNKLHPLLLDFFCTALLSSIQNTSNIFPSALLGRQGSHKIRLSKIFIIRKRPKSFKQNCITLRNCQWVCSYKAAAPSPRVSITRNTRRCFTLSALFSQHRVTFEKWQRHLQKNRLDSNCQRRCDANRAKTGERHVFTQLLFQSRRGKDRGSLNTPWWNLQSPVSVRAINVQRDKTVFRDKQKDGKISTLISHRPQMSSSREKEIETERGKYHSHKVSRDAAPYG